MGINKGDRVIPDLAVLLAGGPRIESVARYEHDLLAYATHALSRIPGVRPNGTTRLECAPSYDWRST
ncbi:hypothetical protein VSR34_24705 [Paraburkholderia sp. JHI2823]|uniref:hypothetical protein n=1 Tax=Paraburkholderia sp. JHI2823 TaxID=3112960 RepID=UPI0031766706